MPRSQWVSLTRNSTSSRHTLARHQWTANSTPQHKLLWREHSCCGAKQPTVLAAMWVNSVTNCGPKKAVNGHHWLISDLPNCQISVNTCSYDSDVVWPQKSEFKTEWLCSKSWSDLWTTGRTQVYGFVLRAIRAIAWLYDRIPVCNCYGGPLTTDRLCLAHLLTVDHWLHYY